MNSRDELIGETIRIHLARVRLDGETEYVAFQNAEGAEGWVTDKLHCDVEWEQSGDVRTYKNVKYGVFGEVRPIELVVPQEDSNKFGDLPNSSRNGSED